MAKEELRIYMVWSNNGRKTKDNKKNPVRTKKNEKNRKTNHKKQQR